MATSYESNLSCAICLEFYDDPRVLPCGHSYCLKCLGKLSKKRSSKGVIKCPLCQAESRCEDGGQTSYTKNCELNSLVQSFIVQSKTHDGTGDANLCGICDARTTAQRACGECEMMYCQKCFITSHPMRRKSLKNHKIVNVDGNFNLKKHKKNDDRSMYCNDCDTLLTVADINNHVKHEVVSLDKACSLFKVKLEEATSSIDLMQSTLQSSFDKSKENLVIVESIFEEIELEVTRKKEEVLSKLKADVNEAKAAKDTLMSTISMHRKLQSRADTISFIEECQNMFRSTSLNQDFHDFRLQLDKLYRVTCKNDGVMNEIQKLELCGDPVRSLQFNHQSAGDYVRVSRDGRKIARINYGSLLLGDHHPPCMNKMRYPYAVLGDVRMTAGRLYWEVEVPQATGERCIFGFGVTSSATPKDFDRSDATSWVVYLNSSTSPMTISMFHGNLHLHNKNFEVTNGQLTHRCGLLLDILNRSLSVIHVKSNKIIHTITNMDTSHGFTPIFIVNGLTGTLRLVDPDEIQRSPLLPFFTAIK